MLKCSKPSLRGGLARFYLCGNIPVCILSDKMRKNIVLKDFPMWILSTEQPYPLTLTYTPRRDTHYEVSPSFSQRNAKWRGRGYLWTKARACHTASACFCLDPVSLGSVFFNCLIVINLVVTSFCWTLSDVQRIIEVCISKVFFFFPKMCNLMQSIAMLPVCQVALWPYRSLKMLKLLQSTKATQMESWSFLHCPEKFCIN